MEDQPDETGKNRDEKGRFVFGASGNPAGRPKGALSITDAIRKRLDEVPIGEQKTRLEQLTEVILAQAIKERDYRAIKQIWNYVDGTPRQSVEFGGKGPLPIPILIDLVKSAGAETDRGDG